MTLSDFECLIQLKVRFTVYGRHTGFLPAPIGTTWNDIECPIQLKVRFTDGTLGVRLLWLLELTMRDCMNTRFYTVSDKNVANEL